MKKIFARFSISGKLWLYAVIVVVLILSLDVLVLSSVYPGEMTPEFSRLLKTAALFTGAAILITFIITRMLIHLISKPLDVIAGTVRQCTDAENSLNVRLADEGTDEISRVAGAFNRFADSVDQRLRELSQYHTYLEAFFRSISIPFLITNLQGNIIRANQSARDFFEIDQEELLNIHLASLIGMSHYNTLLTHLENSRKDIRDYVMTLLTRSGVKKIVELNLSVIKDQQRTISYTIALIDITEKTQTQQEILESQSRLTKTNRALYQKTKELEMVNEKNKRNARKLARLIEISYETIRCNSRQEILDIITNNGKELLDARESIIFLWDSENQQLIPSRTSLPERINKLSPIAQNEGVIWRTYNDNQSYFLSESSLQPGDLQELGLSESEKVGLIAVPISDQDYNHGVAIYLQNEENSFYIEDLHLITSLAHQTAITLDKLYLLEALQEKAHHLEQMNDDLQRSQQQIVQLQKMESLGTLVGGIAHDFNNILGIITPNIDLLRMTTEVNGDVERRLGIIQEAAERAATLTKQLLMFSRNQPVKLSPLSPNHFIREFVPILQSTLGKHIRISMELEKDVANIKADETRLTQVLMNLAVNARDAMPQGGILTFRTRMVDYDDSGEEGKGFGKMVRISVSDTGSGIPGEHLDKIFDPFFTTKSVGKGTGLGLSVVYGIVKSHDGHIEVETALHKGTTFHIFFKPTREKVKPSSPPASLRHISGTGRVLLVDDEDMIRESLSDSLETLGYRVYEANSGTEAIKVVEENPNIEYAVVDLAMPGINGIETIKSIKKIAPHIKTILSSGYVDQEGVLNQHSEITAFLPKPYHLEELVKVIRSLMNQNSHHSKEVK